MSRIEKLEALLRRCKLPLIRFRTNYVPELRLLADIDRALEPPPEPAKEEPVADDELGLLRVLDDAMDVYVADTRGGHWDAVMAAHKDLCRHRQVRRFKARKDPEPPAEEGRDETKYTADEERRHCYALAADALCWARVIGPGGAPPVDLEEGEAVRAVTAAISEWMKQRKGDREKIESLQAQLADREDALEVESERYARAMGREACHQTQLAKRDERIRELDEDRDRLLSGMAKQSNDVAALIEAAVEDREDWDANNAEPPDHAPHLKLYDTTEPFLPTPQPTRAELLEREHEAFYAVERKWKDLYWSASPPNDPEKAHYLAHRAVEEAGA